MVSVCVSFEAFLLYFIFQYFGGPFNKTVIPFALVGYEIIMANLEVCTSARCLSIISNPTHSHGIMVKYYHH